MKWLWWRKKKIDHQGPESVVKPFEQAKIVRRKRLPLMPPIRYYLPKNVIKDTDSIFKKFGKRNAEGYAWWAGYIINENEAQICTAIYPYVETQYGRVHLDRKLLSTMYKKLIELDQILLVELHTHPPGAGGQNDVDAANAAVYYKGFKSIVVPNFGLPKFYSLLNCHVYDYQKNGAWRRMNRSEISSRFIVDETLVEVKIL